MKSSELLGESGFVLLDDRPWPYAVSKNLGSWWLYYWSEGRKAFVSMRGLEDDEVEKLRVHALPPEKAELYFQK